MSEPANMITVGIHAAAFSCAFEGKDFASGQITLQDEQGRGAPIGWAAVRHNGKWTIHPTGGRREFSLDPKNNTQIIKYVQYRVDQGVNMAFHIDRIKRSEEEAPHGKIILLPRKPVRAHRPAEALATA